MNDGRPKTRAGMTCAAAAEKLHDLFSDELKCMIVVYDKATDHIAVLGNEMRDAEARAILQAAMEHVTRTEGMYMSRDVQN